MIKIFCLYYEGKYSTDYVANLYNSLKKHCDVDFEFVCYSDSDVLADRVIPLKQNGIIKEHWFKLQFFDKNFTGDGDIIVMDIDQLIVSNVTEMVNWPVEENELVSYNKWWNKSPHTTINGGWYKFKAGSLDFVWKKYLEDPVKWQLHYYNNLVVHFKYFGEQNFVEDNCREQDVKITMMPGQWVGKWSKIFEQNLTYNELYRDSFNEEFQIMGDEINPNLKIIHFANPDNYVMTERYQWIRNHWNIYSESSSSSSI